MWQLLKHSECWVKNSAEDILNIYFFLIFPRKQGLTFFAICVFGRQFARNFKTNFLKKIICRLLNVQGQIVFLLLI